MSDGDSCVVSVTAFAVFNLILPDLHLVRALFLSFPCLRLPLLVCFWFVWASVFATGCFVNGFKGFCCPPVFYVDCGFSLVGSRILEWVDWWCEIF